MSFHSFLNRGPGGSSDSCHPGPTGEIYTGQQPGVRPPWGHVGVILHRHSTPYKAVVVAPRGTIGAATDQLAPQGTVHTHSPPDGRGLPFCPSRSIALPLPHSQTRYT